MTSKPKDVACRIEREINSFGYIGITVSDKWIFHDQERGWLPIAHLPLWYAHVDMHYNLVHMQARVDICLAQDKG